MAWDQLIGKKSMSLKLANFIFTMFPVGIKNYGDVSFIKFATFGEQKIFEI